MVNTKKTPVEHTQKEMGKESKHIKKNQRNAKNFQKERKRTKKATYIKQKLTGIAGS